MEPDGLDADCINSEIDTRRALMEPASLRRLYPFVAMGSLALFWKAGHSSADRLTVVIAMKIVGLDPGSQRAGYALLHFAGDRVVLAIAGVWDLRGSRSQALCELARVSREWLAEQDADAAAVEGVFHFKNVQSALALAEARGVLLSVAGSLNVPVFDYAPATVKKTVCGHGAATKEQVRDSLRRTVRGLERFQFDGLWHDAIDAVALAVCHAAHARLTRTLTRGRA